jgi:hypothetical protein
MCLMNNKLGLQNLKSILPPAVKDGLIDLWKILFLKIGIYDTSINMSVTCQFQHYC